MPTAAPRLGLVFRPQQPPERLRATAVAAEEAGLDELWLWEDCFAEGGLTTAAIALTATQRIHVGIGLLPVPLRNPALTAMEVAVLARTSPGRFLPGVGHGVLDWMGQVGARAASPLTLLREHLQVLRPLLRGEEVSTDGRYVHLDGVRLAWPPQQVPPLLVGARGPKTLALAGRLGDGVILDCAPDAAGVRAALEAAQAPEGFGVVAFVPAATGPHARERLEAEVFLYGEDGPGALAVGSVEQVADLVGGLAAAGATSVVLQPAGDGEDAQEVLELAAAVRSALA
ncbi:LLM class flavin-dependent oxidoreductase [Kineococcus sp. SYSU DK006]|uniref:LLM class flavin-dependent oxidoreductase n=1 Tax=Kineococcus sp. SYSU DK006 TaxID=3383127 RepID=UPI003D7C858D